MKLLEAFDLLTKLTKNVLQLDIFYVDVHESNKRKLSVVELNCQRIRDFHMKLFFHQYYTSVPTTSYDKVENQVSRSRFKY